jgi:hypothetical protein|tara:strand:+ start:140 stop:739 length:600 start_codon:yes stop_codon:yes gene_type:complete
VPNLKKSGQQPTVKLHKALKRVSVKQLNLEKKYAFMMCILMLLSTSGCVTNQYSNPGQVSSNDRVVGVGYAVINAQEGNSPEEKRLMAIKVSKLEAYRSLAEQLYGQYIESRGTLSNLKMGQEELVSRVEGLIVGARVVSIKPISTDSYQTVMEMGQPEALRRLGTLPAVTAEEGSTDGRSPTGDLSFVGSGFFKKTVD